MEMKKAVFIICAVLLMAANSCDDKDRNFYVTLYGTVSDDETGELIANATIVLSPGGKTKTTGSDGRYEFNDLEAMQYNMTVQKTGYQTNRKTVNALEGDKVEANIPLIKINNLN